MRCLSVFSSDGLLLRDIEASDSISEYLIWLNDEEISKYLEVRLNPPQTERELRDKIEELARSQDSILFGIFLGKDERLIGTVKLVSISEFHERAEIGILIGDRASQRSGNASTAVRLAIGYAKSQLSVKRVYAGYYSSNLASRNLFASLGFSVVATIPDYFRDATGKRQDRVVVALEVAESEHV